MSKWRVTRLIEIEYASQEQMEADMARWVLPANGVKRFGTTSPKYRTATTFPAAWEDEDE